MKAAGCRRTPKRGEVTEALGRGEADDVVFGGDFHFALYVRGGGSDCFQPQPLPRNSNDAKA